MRKLLLATTAGLGLWGAPQTDAFAQTVTPAPLPYQAPYAATYSGGMALPAAPAPTPGTIVVRLNGRVRFYAYAMNGGDTNNNAAGTATGTVGANGQGTATGGNKLSNYGFAEYARLYPGFDGVAANGLKYGANLEIRQDQASGAGGGAFGSVSQQDRARAALYFRRVWGYLGTDQFGTIRMGSTDQPTSLYMTGNFENFDQGGLNGDIPGFLPGNLTPVWPFSDGGSYYTTNKLVYLSPQFFGFDMGVSYEPSTANVSGGNNCGTSSPLGANFVNAAGSFTSAAGANGQGVAGPGCDALSSSPSNAESSRRKNSVDVLVRYRGSFGPVGIAATAAYAGGSHVLDNQTGVPFNNNPTTGTIRRNFEGLSVGDFGLAITVGGLSFGGKYMVGRYGNTIADLEPAGFQHSESSLVGASYTVGPLIFGAHALVQTTPGDLGNAYFGRIRRQGGVAAGATYALAPGVSLWLSGLYYERKQNGFNFVTGQGVTATAPAGNAFSNKISGSIIAVGTGFSW